MTSEFQSEATQPATAGSSDSDVGATAANAVGSTMHEAEAFIARFSEAARADACVGPAQTVGGHTVVPIASVSLQAGFGMGFGGGSDRSQGQGSGGGGGGGGRGASRVIAVVDITDEGVTVRPVPDATALSLAGIALVGIALFVLRGRPPGGLLRFLRQPS
jgi:uncharacterized spore protein YtfJ